MNLLKTAGSYLLARLGEASTWASINAAIAAQFGLHINPDLNGPLAQVVVAGATLVGVLIKEGWQVKAVAK